MAPLYIVAQGDSLSHAAPLYGLTSTDEWLFVLKGLIEAAYGVPVIARNFAIPGTSTGQMVGRNNAFSKYGKPDFAFIRAGTNNNNGTTTVAAGATSTVVPLQAGFGAQYSSGSGIIIGGQKRKITAISSDTVTVPALGSAPASGTAVTMDGEADFASMIAAATAAGCKRLIVMGEHMQNYPGGDTLNAELGTASNWRTLQRLAVQDALALGLDIIYVDNLAYMRGLIGNGAGQEAIGSWCWSAYNSPPGDYHLNSVRTRGTGASGGHDVLAASAFAAIQDKPDWVKAIQALAA
jgi:hypothetical protein